MLLRKQCKNVGSHKNLLRSNPLHKLIAWLSGEKKSWQHHTSWKSSCFLTDIPAQNIPSLIRGLWAA